MFDGNVLKEDEEIFKICAEYLVRCLNSNCLPAYLNQFRLSLLSKTKSPEVGLADTRPIAIGSHLLKVVEKAIKSKIESLNSKLLQVDSYQAGFQTGLST